MCMHHTLHPGGQVGTREGVRDDPDVCVDIVTLDLSCDDRGRVFAWREGDLVSTVCTRGTTQVQVGTL
jgi:hypothetical protein